jgi:hypothetical protein
MHLAERGSEAAATALVTAGAARAAEAAAR